MTDIEDVEDERPQQPITIGLPPTVLSTEQLQQATKFVLEHEKGSSDSPFEEVCEPRKRAFLIAYALCGVKSKACVAAGISMQLLYTRHWREDKGFQEAMKVAADMAVDVMEDEAHRRAVEGWVEPTGWYKGAPGGYVRRFSDVLLIFKLKGALPDKYKDRVEMRGMLASIDLTKLSDDQIKRIVVDGEHPLAVVNNPGKSAQPALPAGQPVEAEPENDDEEIEG